MHNARKPSHHDAKPLHMFRIQLRRILLLLPPIGSLERMPRNAKAMRLGSSFLGRRKVVLVRKSGLLATGIWVFGEQRVFENQSVSLAIAFADVQLNTIIFGEVPGLRSGGGALAGETSAAEGFDVEVAEEAGFGVAELQVGLWSFISLKLTKYFSVSGHGT